MNLVLLFKDDFISSARVQLKDRRRDHIAKILKSKSGDLISVGLCDGKVGKGTVVQIGETVLLDVVLNEKPPAALALTLILALPRPHMFKRALAFAASLGIKKIVILNFVRVEKSLWNSSTLKPENIREQLLLGLEQSRDTILPEVVIKKNFKVFVKQELPALLKGSLGLLAHPGGQDSCPRAIEQKVTLVIGPEGGIVPSELTLLQEAGFKTVDLGPRILRVDAVLPYIVGKLAF